MISQGLHEATTMLKYITMIPFLIGLLNFHLNIWVNRIKGQHEDSLRTITPAYLLYSITFKRWIQMKKGSNSSNSLI
jgi:hypothetical protein